MNADQLIGETVHTLMRRRKLSQEQLGNALGLTQAAAGRKVLGARKWTVDELIATARFLDVEVIELLPGNDYAPILEGRGRVAEVRPKGLEPLTFWSVVGEGFWTAERSLSLSALWCQLDLDIESSISEEV